MFIDREIGGSMLNVSGFNHIYYIRNFTDMRCKHPRVLSVIREQLHREPSEGDVYKNKVKICPQIRKTVI